MGLQKVVYYLNGNLKTDNLEIEGILNSDEIKEEVLAGRYDFANIEIFLLNYKDPSHGIISFY